MSLDTYANLTTALGNWARRTDSAFTAAILDALVMVEAQVNRRLRTLDMTLRATATISDEFSAVPSDFQGVKSLVLATGVALRYATPDQLTEWAALNTESGEPEWFSIVGDEFRYYPAPSDSYTATLTYWQSVPALSSTNTTNWLLTKHPDIYLYGCRMQLDAFLKNFDQIPAWAALYKTAMDDLDTSNRTAEAGPYLTPIPSLVV